MHPNDPVPSASPRTPHQQGEGVQAGKSEHKPEQNPVANKPEDEDGIRLRRDFVSMLFALAAGQVAIFAYSVFNAEPPYAGCAPGEHWWWFAAALAHLALALLVLATSWVGWSRSTSAAQSVHGVFDRDFPAWILDVLLVVIYFFLASSVEVKTTATGDVTLTPPSVAPELRWTFWLMGLYVAWDACTKWWPKGGRPANVKWILNAVSCTFASGVTVLALWAFEWAIEMYVRPITAADVVFLDIGLMALVVLFRVLKSAEKVWFEARGWRASTKADVESHWCLKAACLTLVAAGSCVAAHYLFE